MTFFIVALGLIGALAAAFAASRIPTSRGRGAAATFGFCSFILGILIYCGVLQGLVLHAHPAATFAAAIGPEAIFVGFTTLAAISGFIGGVGIVWGWIALDRAGERPADRFRTTGLALLFSLAVVILAAPFLIHNQITIERSIDANEAEIHAFSTSYKNGLEKLTKLGALRRIEIGDDTVTHYIGEPLYKVGEQGLAEYARAAMIYHTHVLGNARMPVVLRDSTTDLKIGTFRTDGVFVVHTAVISPQAAAPR